MTKVYYLFDLAELAVFLEQMLAGVQALRVETGAVAQALGVVVPEMVDELLIARELVVDLVYLKVGLVLLVAVQEF